MLTACEKSACARTYGRAHGYRGAVGGWIYDGAGVPVCQGWFAFFARYRGRIEKWR